MEKKLISFTYLLFSRLLLKSFIISDKNKRRTSISSALGVEFFNKVATTLRITLREQIDWLYLLEFRMQCHWIWSHIVLATAKKQKSGAF